MTPKEILRRKIELKKQHVDLLLAEISCLEADLAAIQDEPLPECNR